MTAGNINRAVVADRVALIRRLLDEAGTLPLDDRVGDVDEMVTAVTIWMAAHPERVSGAD